MSDTPRVDAQVSEFKKFTVEPMEPVKCEACKLYQDLLTAAHKRIAELDERIKFRESLVASQKTEIEKLYSRIAEMEQVSAAGVKDADYSAMYVWLRDNHIGDDPESISLAKAKKPGLDAAIRSAMAKAVQS